jgi:hypothetical protein
MNGRAGGSPAIAAPRSRATDAIRPFRRDDIPDVVALYNEVFPATERSGTSDLESFFDIAFFGSPLTDEEGGSLVYVGSGGDILGFLGVQPRRLSIRGRTLHAAVCTKFMMARRAGINGAALRMLRSVFDRPLDLVMSDLANEPARRLWEGLGGRTALLGSLYWSRALRPARYLVSRITRRRPLKALAFAARPLADIADRVVARHALRWFPRGVAGHTSENLDLDTLVTCLPTVCRERPLRPDYDARSLQWLLELMSDANPTKPLRKQLVRNAQGEVVGWFLYFLERGGESSVVQMAASKRSAEAVLQMLLADAWSQGSVVLSGRFEPGFVGPLSSHGCAFSHGPWMLVHSKQPDVLDAILSGEAFLSRLEGEW